jgi:hypothetical protein
MGKRLIIKDADFSQNGIEVKGWFIDELDVLSAAGIGTLAIASAASAGWAFLDAVNEKIVGRRLNKVKFRAATQGVLNFYVVSDLSMIPSTPNASVVVGSEDVGVDKEYDLSNVVTIRAGERLVIGEPGMAGGVTFYYLGFAGAEYGFYRKVGTPEYNIFESEAGSSLYFNVGFFKTD